MTEPPVQSRDRDAKPDGGPSWRVEGAPPRRPEGARGRPGRQPMRPPFGWGRFLLIVAALFLLNQWIVSTLPDREPRVKLPYTTFRTEVSGGNVAELTSKGDAIQGELKAEITYPPDAPKDEQLTSKLFETQRPSFLQDDGLWADLEAKGVTVNARPLDTGRSLANTLLLGFGPTILLIGIFIWLFRRAAGGAGGGVSGLGRSRAKRYEVTADRRTTFEDVAGIDEAENELVEIVDFLKQPDKYRRLGGAIPKGVLLYGPPGTGKTLLARAVAGEAGVPFFSMSASEFIEMIVGVGASRVRDLFKQAKEAAPAIIFIDELDAIGRQRGGGQSLGGHDEREQTLNQILTEMDGFDGSEGVIVIAATNRPDILDKALLRPGRFDRRVAVQAPDQHGRRLILEVHTRERVPLADDVDLDAIASTTPGMVGADLKNLVNEAALMAARRGHERVALADFTDALEKIILGAERRIMISRAEKERTAYHESGHALIGMVVPGADPVRKVSIIPRGQALGVTLQSPESDRYGFDEAYLRGRITSTLGGRAAEEIIYGTVTTGAESDLEQVTRIARMMVGRWGYSPRVGQVSVLPGPQEESVFFPGAPGSASERTRELVDEEVRRIIDECYVDALRLLREHAGQLEALTRRLLEKETLDEAEIYEVVGIERVHVGSEAVADEATEAVREGAHHRPPAAD